MVVSFMGSSFLSWWSVRYDRTEARISSIAAESVRPSPAGGYVGPASASSARPATRKPLRLVDTQTVEGDVAFLTYELVRDA
jgi:hypothetical protein